MCKSICFFFVMCWIFFSTQEATLFNSSKVLRYSCIAQFSRAKKNCVMFPRNSRLWRKQWITFNACSPLKFIFAKIQIAGFLVAKIVWRFHCFHLMEIRFVNLKICIWYFSSCFYYLHSSPLKDFVTGSKFFFFFTKLYHFYFWNTLLKKKIHIYKMISKGNKSIINPN